MKATPILAALLFLYVAASSARQQTTPADQLTGTWTGYMGRSDGERQPITVELQFDRKTIVGRVTGPPYPGEITAGTFDAGTGALNFKVVVQDEHKSIAVFAGSLANGTANGTVALNGQQGVFRLTKNTGTAADFDYLLGDWQFTAENKQYGKLYGYWSAVRLATGQILDEYRIVGEKGETYYATTTLRNYNKAQDRWELISADAGGGLQDFGTGRRVGSEMHIEQTFGATSGQPSTWKIRYYNIQPDGFSWTGDRSTDGGKTWTKDFQQIEAHRIGAARSLPPLAAPKKTGSE